MSLIGIPALSLSCVTLGKLFDYHCASVPHELMECFTSIDWLGRAQNSARKQQVGSKCDLVGRLSLAGWEVELLLPFLQSYIC